MKFSISLWITFMFYIYCYGAESDEYYDDIIEETRLKVAIVTKGKNNNPVALIRKMYTRYYKEKASDDDDFEEVEETKTIIYGKFNKTNLKLP
ncbi:hypothetical protein KSF78_0005079 [Schistosoma japonicum]|nr:hypothetical protein KSF78_0005079 [Schistosoma japonicum]